MNNTIKIVNDICSILRQKKWLMGTAESCTGGGIAKAITDIPGISDVFAGSIVAYSNELKNKLLGVHWKTLETYGAVSSDTALEMVAGLAERLELQAGIAVTGIAGPGGGSKEKPVGLVYIATFLNNHCECCEYHFPKDRQFVREQTTITALNMLHKVLFSGINGQQ